MINEIMAQSSMKVRNKDEFYDWFLKSGYLEKIVESMSVNGLLTISFTFHRNIGLSSVTMYLKYVVTGIDEDGCMEIKLTDSSWYQDYPEIPIGLNNPDANVLGNYMKSFQKSLKGD
jgi:hypothetical protein